MSTNVQFKRGLLNTLSSQQIKDGTIYVTTDEHAMYIDHGTQRIRLGDFIPVDTIEDLPSAGHAYETAMYYVKTNNILARWDKTNNRWIQINKAGVVGVEITGSGNIISDITTVVANDGTLKLKVTKTTVASADDLINLAARVSTNENNIEDLQEDVTKFKGGVEVSGSILNIANDVKTTLLGGETSYTTLKTVGDALRQLMANIQGYDNRITANAEAIDVLNGTGEGSVAKIVATEIAKVIANAPESYDTLKEIADWINDHPNTVADINTAITNLANRVSDLETDVSSLKTRMTTAEGKITTLETAVATLNGDVNTTNSVDYKINQATQNLNTDISNLRELVDSHDQSLTWTDWS